MNSQKSIVIILLTLLITITGCSENRVHVSEVENRIENDIDQIMYNGEPYTGIVFENYSDGNLKNEVKVVNGIMSGESKEYYPNGELKELTTFESGVPTGLHELYFESGQLGLRTNLVFVGKERIGDNGIRRDGSYEKFYPNGQLNIKTTYEKGVLNGSYLELSEEGDTLKNITYGNQ